MILVIIVFAAWLFFERIENISFVVRHFEDRTLSWLKPSSGNILTPALRPQVYTHLFTPVRDCICGVRLWVEKDGG